MKYKIKPMEHSLSWQVNICWAIQEGPCS